MRKNKSSFIRRIYKECWQDIKKTKKYIAFSSSLLLISALVGFFFPVFFVEQVRDALRNILIKTLEYKGISLIFYIFQNNLIISFLGLFFGLIFGIIPILLIVGNGYVLGFVSNLVVGAEGFAIMWRLLPHGIFELPAIILSISFGIKLGMSMFSKKPVEKLKENLVTSAKIFLFIIIPLLLIAALVEGTLILLSS